MPDPWFRTAFGAHYPLLYSHRDEAEARRCLDLLPRLAPGLWPDRPGRGPVLDLGCGEGRHLALLTAAGIPVLGLDLSPALLAAAAERLAGPGRPALVRGDMRSLPLTDRSISVVLSLFTAFGYFGTLAQNEPVLAQIARVLQEGGSWVLDYVDCDRVRAELGDPGAGRERIRDLGALRAVERRRLAEGGALVVKEVELVPVACVAGGSGVPPIGPEGLSYREQVALFTLAEIDAAAGACGLERVAGAGDYAGSPLGAGDRWLLVFRRMGLDSGPGGRR